MTMTRLPQRRRRGTRSVALLGAVPRPPSITSATLQLYLTAESGVYQDTSMSVRAMADGDPVAGWRDLSGNGNHFTQATLAKQPILKLNQSPTGKPGVQFDGTDDYLECLVNFILNQTAGHILARLKVAADPPPGAPNVGAIWRFATATTETDYPFTDSKIYGGFLNASAWVPTLGFDPPATVATYRTFEEYKSGGNGSIVLDGSVLATEAKADAGASAAVPRLGTQNTTNIFAAVTFTRILVYNAPLSAADRAAIETWLGV